MTDIAEMLIEHFQKHGVQLKANGTKLYVYGGIRPRERKLIRDHYDALLEGVRELQEFSKNLLEIT